MSRTFTVEVKISDELALALVGAEDDARAWSWRVMETEHGCSTGIRDEAVTEGLITLSGYDDEYVDWTPVGEAIRAQLKPGVENGVFIRKRDGEDVAENVVIENGVERIVGRFKPDS